MITEGTLQQGKVSLMPRSVVKCQFVLYYSGFRIRRARVIKCNRFPRQKRGHSPRRSMCRPRKLGTRTRILLARDRIRCFGKKALASIVPYTFISHTKMLIFFRKVRPRVIFLKASQVSSCLKSSREITTLTESIVACERRPISGCHV